MMKIPEKPQWLVWDHNIHYHRFLLRQVPRGARTALDVGCGTGLFATRVATKVPEVIAIDRDPVAIQAARASSHGSGVKFVQADLFDLEMAPGSFDFISCLSALHHVPLRPALERFATLLAPGGTLVVLGHYTLSTPFDYAYVGLAGLVDLAVGAIRHRTQAPLRRPNGVVAEWHNTLREIRSAAQSVLPGATIRRHLYDRYSLAFSRSGPSRFGRLPSSSTDNGAS